MAESVPKKFSSSHFLVWGLFSLFSLGTVIAGSTVARANGVPTGEWTRNIGAWLAGAIVAAVLPRLSSKRANIFYLVLALAGLAATMIFSGLSGVHRWIVLGPVRLNAAELLLPMAIVSYAGLGLPSKFGVLIASTIAVVLALQPDASQAAAFAGGLIALLLASDLPTKTRALAAVVPAACAIIALIRPDPLLPVPEVEGIVGLAFAMSPAVAVFAVLCLALAVAVPLVAGFPQRSPLRVAGIGLSTYFALTALAPLVAAFPVPLMGMGVSPILGTWLGMGLLMSFARRTP